MIPELVCWSVGVHTQPDNIYTVIYNFVAMAIQVVGVCQRIVQIFDALGNIKDSTLRYLYSQRAQRMEIETTFNSSQFSYNETTIPGRNHSLQCPLPAWTIATLTICSVEIMANSIVISVITFSSLRSSVFMNLVMILAIFDVLYLLAVINVQNGIFGQFLIDPSVVHCSLNNFLLYVCGVVSSWVTLLISLERFIVIYFPLKGRINCTKKRSCAIVLALFIISCSCLVPLLYISKVTLKDQGHLEWSSTNAILNNYFHFLQHSSRFLYSSSQYINNEKTTSRNGFSSQISNAVL